MHLHGESRRKHLLIAVVTPMLILAAAGGAAIGFQSPVTSQAHRATGTCRTKPAVTYSAVSALPSGPARGSTVHFSVTMTASCATSGLIDFEVYNATGARAWVNWKDNQQLTGQKQTFSATWNIPTSLATGPYTLKIGVFSRNWTKLYNWNNAALRFSVQGASTPQPTPVPTKTGMTPTPVPSKPATTSTPVPPKPSTTPAPASQPSGTFSLLPVGAQLPSDAECAARVKRSSWEPRPENTAANNRNLYAEGVRAQWNGNDSVQSMMNRVTGNFTGTTDEILQWGACKWGFDLDTVRAQAVQESDWHQSALGDCGANTQSATHGCASVGILQVKGADIPADQAGTWPYAYESTAWNVDYTLSVRRACFEGKVDWLFGVSNGYHAGDEWGCIGFWFSGRWYDSGAQNYIASVKSHEANKDWLRY